MNDEQISALTSLANSPAWEIVSKEIFEPYIKDVTEPYDVRIEELCKRNPAAAYIGRLMATAILKKMLLTVSKFQSTGGESRDTQYN